MIDKLVRMVFRKGSIAYYFTKSHPHDELERVFFCIVALSRQYQCDSG